MNLPRTSPPAFALALACVGLLFCAFDVRGHAVPTASAYLFAWLFFLGLSLGSLGALMMHNLTGGRWSAPVQRYFLAALSPLPLLALLFVPIVLGVGHLYPWATGSLGADEPLHFKLAYVTYGGFLARSAIALVAWNVLALLLRAGPPERVRSGALSAAGLIIYAVTMTWAAVDWIGSLLPQWSSSVLGLLVVTGQGLAAFALATLGATRGWRVNTPPTAAECGDLGNLLLTFVMTWMYLAFMQFLIVWAEDLPRETNWFLPRLQGEWQILAVMVVVLQFALPFALLLFRRLKRDPDRLGLVASFILLGNWLDVAWLILPSVRSGGPRLAWPDLFATAGVGGLWCYGFLRALNRAGPDPSAAQGGASPSLARDVP